MKIGGKVRVCKGEDKDAAVRASIKHEAGDIAGTVRGLSHCSYVVLDAKSFDSSLKTPSDSPRQAPSSEYAILSLFVLHTASF